MAHGPIFLLKIHILHAEKPRRSAKSPQKFKELLVLSEIWRTELRILPIYLLPLDRFSGSKSHLHFKMAFERIGPYRYHEIRDIRHGKYGDSDLYQKMHPANYCWNKIHSFNRKLRFGPHGHEIFWSIQWFYCECTFHVLNWRENLI